VPPKVHTRLNAPARASVGSANTVSVLQVSAVTTTPCTGHTAMPRPASQLVLKPVMGIMVETTKKCDYRASLFFMFPLGNPHTKPRRFFLKNCPGHPPKQPTTQQSFFHLRLPGLTASATLTVGSCKHLGQDIHTHAERWALWPGLKRTDRDWGAEDTYGAVSRVDLW
jgi:hypothetical protein